jgi:hypothetical protein
MTFRLSEYCPNRGLGAGFEEVSNFGNAFRRELPWSFIFKAFRAFGKAGSDADICLGRRDARLQEARQIQHGISGEEPEDAREDQDAPTGLEEVGQNARDEDKQEGQRDELKALARVMWRDPAQKQAENADNEWRGVAEVTCARPGEIHDERSWQEEDHSGTVFA